MVFTRPKKIVVLLLVGLLVLGLGGTAVAERKVIIGLEAGDIYELFKTFVPQIKKDLGIDIEFRTWPMYERYEVIMLTLTSKTPSVDLVTYSSRGKGDFGLFMTDFSTIVDDPYKELEMDKILPAYREPFMMYQGKWIGVTYDNGSCTLLYRKDLFEDPKERAAYKKKYRMALRPPYTSQEYDQIAEFFTRPEEGLWGHGGMFKRTWENTEWFFTRLIDYGGAFWDENGKCRLNDEIGVRAMTGLVNSTKWCPPGWAAVGYSELRKLYFDGKIAMMIHWACGPKVAADPKYAVEKVYKNVGVHRLPGRWAQMFGGRVWGIPKITVHDKRDAFATLKWLNRPEFTSKLVADTSTHLDPWAYHHLDNPSIYQELYAVGAAEEYCRAELEAATRGMPHCNIKFWRRYEDACSKRISQAMMGELTPKEACDRVAKDWDSITEDGGPAQLKEIKGWQQTLANRGWMYWHRGGPNWND